jgi:hypothetical protein
LAEYAASYHSQINDYASANVALDNAQAYVRTSRNCTTLWSLPEIYSCQSSTTYMLPTISYYNGVSDLHRHRTMEEQLDRTSSKDSPSSNAGIDLVLEEQREPIVGLLIEDVFVLHLNFRLS